MRAEPPGRLPGTDDFPPIHVGAQRLGDSNRAVRFLIVLEDRQPGPPDREAGAVQRVHVMTLAVRGPKADVRAPRLESLEIAARGDFTETILARQPYLDVIGFGGGESHVAGAEHHDAIV